VAEQSDGTRAENIPLLAFIIRIEARDVEDVSATRLLVCVRKFCSQYWRF